MAQKQVKEFPACTTPTSNDILFGQGNNLSTSYKFEVGKLFLTLTIPFGNTPNAETTAPAGRCWQNNGIIYIATSNSTIKKIELQDL